MSRSSSSPDQIGGLVAHLERVIESFDRHIHLLVQWHPEGGAFIVESWFGSGGVQQMVEFGCRLQGRPSQEGNSSSRHQPARYDPPRRDQQEQGGPSSSLVLPHWSTTADNFNELVQSFVRKELHQRGLGSSPELEAPGTPSQSGSSEKEGATPTTTASFSRASGVDQSSQDSWAPLDTGNGGACSQ